MRRSFVSKRTSTVLAFLFIASAAACGGGGSSSYGGVTGPANNPPPVTSTTKSLTVSNNKYTPARDSVAPGSTLTWTWNSCTGDGYGGSACTSHSVQFDDGGESSDIQDSGTFSRTFTTAGTYTYHCAVHGVAMAGTVIVK